MTSSVPKMYQVKTGGFYDAVGLGMGGAGLMGMGSTPSFQNSVFPSGGNTNNATSKMQSTTNTLNTLAVGTAILGAAGGAFTTVTSFMGMFKKGGNGSNGGNGAGDVKSNPTVDGLKSAMKAAKKSHNYTALQTQVKSAMLDFSKNKADIDDNQEHIEQSANDVKETEGNIKQNKEAIATAKEGVASAKKAVSEAKTPEAKAAAQANLDKAEEELKGLQAKDKEYDVQLKQQKQDGIDAEKTKAILESTGKEIKSAIADAQKVLAERGKQVDSAEAPDKKEEQAPAPKSTGTTAYNSGLSLLGPKTPPLGQKDFSNAFGTSVPTKAQNGINFTPKKISIFG